MEINDSHGFHEGADPPNHPDSDVDAADTRAT